MFSCKGICSSKDVAKIGSLGVDISGISSSSLFSNIRAARVMSSQESLVAQGLHAVALHGGRTQSERESALHSFGNGSNNILVATDVASRGLDVSGVAHVINLDLPKSMDDYVHRIGRTGRACSMGHSTSLYIDRDMYLVAQIRKAITNAESGNTVSFATGKVSRRKEKEAAFAH